MTIKNFTFFSPNGTEFPVGSNNDGKLYLLLSGIEINGNLRKDWANPLNTALNRMYSNTSMVVGGRYFELVNEMVALTANATNYIHANIDLTKTTNPVSISAESSNNTNNVDINNGSGVLKVCFEKVVTSGTGVISATSILSARKFENLSVTGELSRNEKTVSTPFTWEYGLTGTLRRTGNVVEWIVNRTAVNGSSVHEQTAGAIIPAGYRPIERAYAHIDLTSTSGFIPWAVARIDSNGNTYITNNATTGTKTPQGYNSWITNDDFPQ